MHNKLFITCVINNYRYRLIWNFIIMTGFWAISSRPNLDIKSFTLQRAVNWDFGHFLIGIILSFLPTLPYDNTYIQRFVNRGVTINKWLKGNFNMATTKNKEFQRTQHITGCRLVKALFPQGRKRPGEHVTDSNTNCTTHWQLPPCPHITLTD